MLGLIFFLSSFFLSLTSPCWGPHISCLALQLGLRHGYSSLAATITRCGVLCFKTSRLQDWFVALHRRIFWHICKSEGPIWSGYVSISFGGILVPTAFFVSPVIKVSWFADIFLNSNSCISLPMCKKYRCRASLNSGLLKRRILRRECSPLS